MRIAMFTDTYYPARDGVITSMINTVKELREMGHEVFIFAPDDEKHRISDEQNDRYVYLLKAKEFRWYPQYRMAIFPTDLKRTLTSLNVDIIHSHGIAFMGFKSMVQGRKLGVPVVLTFHTMVTDGAKHYFPIMPHEIAESLANIYLKVFLQRVSAVVAPSSPILNEIKKLAPEMKKWAVIPSGIDPERFHEGVDGSSLRKRLGLENNTVFLYVGRMGAEKNLKLLIEAFPYILKERPDSVLIMVGDGPVKEKCMKEAEKSGLGDRIRFMGFVSDEEVPLFYSMADAFIFPSRFETQGLVALESMAVGTPVAGINYRAIPDFIEDGKSGYLFENDPESCASAALKAADAPESVIKAGIETAKKYSRRLCAERLLELYEELIDENRRKNGRKRTGKVNISSLQ